MDKLDPKTDGASPDITAENIDKLRELFPDAFTEGSDADGPRWKVDFDALKQILGEHVEDERERYSFTWHGKARARRIAQTPSNGTLRPCPEESVNWDTTKNLFIEGDNLEVLKLLQKSYHKQVKMIYIDPPYNTGGEFIYPDRFQDNLDTYLRYTGQVDAEGFKVSANSESSGRYHTNWLNMMYPRLRLARNLLTTDGFIFITIDDNESPNLRKILDEIFGEENFIANIAWQKRTSPDMRTSFSEAFDHVIFYAKNKHEGLLSLNKLALTEKQRSQFKNPDNDSRGPWVSSDFTAQGTRPNQLYKIVSPSGKEFYPPKGNCWKNTETEYLRQKREGRFWFGKDGSAMPRRKTYLSESKGRTPWSWWPNAEVGHTQEAKREINSIFDASDIFPTPKPTRLISRMLELTTSCSDIVLDFFAGSGATGEAVLSKNIEDGESRRFILVQLPEKCSKESAAFESGYNTISEIGKERIRKVCKSNWSNGKHLAGVRVFRLDSSNVIPWPPTENSNLPDLINKLVNNYRADRSADDVLNELLLKFGLDLAVPIEECEIAGKTVHVIGAGALVVCLADQINLAVVDGIAALKAELAPEIMRVVFKDSGFADDVVKTNAVQRLRQAGIDDVKSL